jgi:glucans biosynthesis protein C
MPWVDHLRTAVILLVVNMHACVTYSHVGDWYMMSEHEPTLAAKVPFIVWQGHLQSFFMGLLFFVSGYFAHCSLARRRPGEFLRERLVRLGLPALLYMLVLHPFILLVLNPWHADFGPWPAFYGKYLRTGRFLGSSGPLWFAVALLIFCAVLAGWRAVRPPQMESAPSRPVADAPSSTQLWIFAVTLGLVTFAVRLVQPIGTNILNLQLCFFPQYIAVFALGVHAARHGWLLSLAASSRARFAGWLALCGGPVLQLTVMTVGIKFGSLTDFFGGWHGQALGLALWEQLTGVGLSLGLLALFSRTLNFETPALHWLAQRSFGVYVLHAPILVALAIAFRALPQNLYLLVALLTFSGLLLSFIAADLARRVPGLRAIL